MIGPRRPLRSVVAVIAGLLVIGILSTATDFALGALHIAPSVSERWSDTMLLLAMVYRIVYSVAGCYLAARLAPTRAMQHALVLGAIGFAASIAGAVTMRDVGPAWYPITLIVTAMPCAWLGGKLHGIQSSKHAA